MFFNNYFLFTEAEILALHVQLDAVTNKKCITKDASTQVYLSIGKKTQSK